MRFNIYVEAFGSIQIILSMAFFNMNFLILSIREFIFYETVEIQSEHYHRCILIMRVICVNLGHCHMKIPVFFNFY